MSRPMSSRLAAAAAVVFTCTGLLAAADPPLGLVAPKDPFLIWQIDGLALRNRDDLQPLAEFLRRMRPYMPIDALSVDEMQVSLSSRTGQGGFMPFTPFMVMRFNDPAAAQELIEISEGEGLVAKEYKGRKYLSSKNQFGPSIYHIDRRTVIFSFDSLIEEYLDGEAPPAEIREAYARKTMQGQVKVLFAPESQLANLGTGISQPGFPPQLALLIKNLKHVSLISGRIDLSGPEAIRVEFDAKGEEGTREIERRLESAAVLAKDSVNDILLPLIDRSPVPAELKKLARPFAAETIAKLQVTSQGQRVSVSLPFPAAAQAIARQLLPIGVKKMTEELYRERRSTDRYHLQAIGQHLKEFRKKQNGEFPNDLFDRNGKPLMSWRVELMLKSGQLREEGLQPTLPWNAEPNLGILASTFYPYVVTPGLKPKAVGPTNLLRFTGPGTMFRDGKSWGQAEIKDGLANTIFCIVVPSSQWVPWGEPSDLAFDAKHPLGGLAGIDDDFVQALFCDGTVRRIPKAIKPEEFRALITPAGGERVDLMKFENADPFNKEAGGDPFPPDPDE